MMYYSYGFGPLYAVMHVFGWLLFVLAIILIVRAFRWGGRGAWRGDWRQDGPASHSALDLLKERYVKGEIDRAEFEQKKKDLES